MRKTTLLFAVSLALFSVQSVRAAQPPTLPTEAVSLTQDNSGLSATFEPAGTLYALQQNTFHVTLTNNGDEEYSGYLWLLGNPTQDMGFVDGQFTSAEAGVANVTVAPHTTSVVDVNITIYNRSSSDYLFFSVFDKDENKIASTVKLFINKNPKPILMFVSAENNATPDDYDTENCIYNGRKYKIPRVNDDYAWVKFGVKNMSGASAGKIRWRMDATNQTTGKVYSKGFATVDIPDDGSIVYFEQKWTPAEVSGSFMQIDLTTAYMDSNESPLQYVDMDNYMRFIPLVDDETRGLQCPANLQWLYVAGKSVGIDNVEQGTGVAVAGGEGELLLRSDRAERIGIYAVDGRQVAQASVLAGVESRVTLPAGLYIVKGTKVMVR